MRFLNQSTAATFLIAILAMVMWASSDAAAQEENPFGFDTPASKPEVKPKPTELAKKPAPRRTPPVTSDSDEIRKRISRDYDLVYNGEPFSDLLSRLTDDLGINVVIDTNLEGVLDGDTEISANLSGISMAEGLRTMLKMLDATYTIKDGVLLIISIDDEYEADYLTRHMINVSDLLRMIKETESDRIGKPVAVSVESIPFPGAKAGGGGGTFQVAPEAPANVAQPPQETKQLQQFEILTADKILTDAITRVVASDSWQQNGGGNGDLICVGNVLIAISSEKVAEDVRGFIDDLKNQMSLKK